MQSNTNTERDTWFGKSFQLSTLWPLSNRTQRHRWQVGRHRRHPCVCPSRRRRLPCHSVGREEEKITLALPCGSVPVSPTTLGAQNTPKESRQTKKKLFARSGTQQELVRQTCSDKLFFEWRYFGWFSLTLRCWMMKAFFDSSEARSNRFYNRNERWYSRSGLIWWQPEYPSNRC